MKILKLRSKIKFVCLCLFLSTAPFLVRAQIGFDATADGGGVTDTPIDGGVALLVAAGTLFGGIKIYKIHTQKRLQKIG